MAVVLMLGKPTHRLCTSLVTAPQALLNANTYLRLPLLTRQVSYVILKANGWCSILPTTLFLPMSAWINKGTTPHLTHTPSAPIAVRERLSHLLGAKAAPSSVDNPHTYGMRLCRWWPLPTTPMDHGSIKKYTHSQLAGIGTQRSPSTLMKVL